MGEEIPLLQRQHPGRCPFAVQLELQRLKGGARLLLADVPPPQGKRKACRPAQGSRMSMPPFLRPRGAAMRQRHKGGISASLPYLHGGHAPARKQPQLLPRPVEPWSRGSVAAGTGRAHAPLESHLLLRMWEDPDGH